METCTLKNLDGRMFVSLLIFGGVLKLGWLDQLIPNAYEAGFTMFLFNRNLGIYRVCVPIQVFDDETYDILPGGGILFLPFDRVAAECKTFSLHRGYPSGVAAGIQVHPLIEYGEVVPDLP